MFKETTLRSIIKACSWRFFGSLVTVVFVYVLTRRLDIAAVVGGFEIVGKIVLFALHERLWNEIGLGKVSDKPFVLWLHGRVAEETVRLARELCALLRKAGRGVECLGAGEEGALTDMSAEASVSGRVAAMLERNGVASIVLTEMPPTDDSRASFTSLLEVDLSKGAAVSSAALMELLREKKLLRLA